MTTEIYSFRVLEGPSPNSRCPQGCASSEALGKTLPCVLLAVTVAGHLWCPLAFSYIPPVVIWHSVSVSKFPSSCKDTSQCTLIQDDFTLNLITSTKSLPPNKVTFVGTGGWTCHIASWVCFQAVVCGPRYRLKLVLDC